MCSNHQHSPCLSPPSPSATLAVPCSSPHGCLPTQEAILTSAAHGCGLRYTHKGPASSNPIVFLNLLLLQLSATSWVLNSGRPCPPQQTRSRLWLQACICNLPSRVSRQAVGCSQNAIKPQAHTRPLQYQTQCFTSSRYPSAASRSKRPSRRAP